MHVKRTDAGKTISEGQEKNAGAFGHRIWSAGSRLCLLAVFLFCISTLALMPVIAYAATLSPSSLPNGVVGTNYDQLITVSGTGVGYDIHVTAGALPPGLSLNFKGYLSGNPTVQGTYTFTIFALDAFDEDNASQSYTIEVLPAPLAITTSALANGIVGVGYSQTLSASGGTTPYSFAIISGALPAGLSLSSDGVISGMPTVSGSYPLTVQVTDSVSDTDAKSFTLDIAAPTITLSPATLAGATQNSVYSQQFTASGGTVPYTYAVTSGSIPAGLSLSSSGVLSGTPTGYGNFNFTITATDSSVGTGPYTGSQSYTLSIAVAQPVITTDSVANGAVGGSYSQTINAESGNAPYTFSIATGSLPTGLALSSGGTLSGTPTAAGSYTFTVQVTDAASQTATKALSITVFESGCDIVSFSLAGVSGSIDSGAHTVTVTVPFATDVTSLKASFSLSTGASAKVNGAAQTSGSTVNDFTNAVTYKVTAQDTVHTQNWTVVCKVAAAPATPTPIPTAIPTPTPAPTATPTPAPTSTPTPKPTRKPTKKPTATPTPVVYMADVKVESELDSTLLVTVLELEGASYAFVDAGEQSFTPGGTVITVPAIPEVVAYLAGIPVQDLNTSVEEGTLTLETEAGSITLPSNMLTGVEGVSGSRAEIAIGQGDKTQLSDDVQAAIGDQPFVMLALLIDGTQTEWSNPDVPVTVSIPYTPTKAELTSPEGIVVWYVDGSGNAVQVTGGQYDALTGMVTFPVTQF